MANISVYIPTSLRRLSGGQAHVDVPVEPGATLAELVDVIDARHPGLKAELWEGADFKQYVNVYMNGEEVRGLAGAATRLDEGDQIAFVPMLAGGAEAFALRSDHRDEMIRHALEDAPNECCGVMMLDTAGQPYVLRLVNADASPFSYTVRSEDLFDVVVRRPDAGEELLAIYHSHVNTEAYPSQTDVRAGLYPEVAYVIVSLRDRAHPAVRAFRIVDGAVSEMEIVPR